MKLTLDSKENGNIAIQKTPVVSVKSTPVCFGMIKQWTVKNRKK